MSRRSGQAGAVVCKGNTWHGRYYVDVPGQEERKRVSIPLGPTHSMSKPEARRKLQAALEQAGVNSEASFVRATQPLRTFAQEAEWWKQNRLSLFKPSCQETMGQHVDKYLLPRFGNMPATAIDERQVQEFVATLNRDGNLKPKSIRNVIGVLKLILGEKVWRDWNLVLPEVPMREQRFFTENEIWAIVATILQESGVPGDLVKEWVAHPSLRTTSRYTHFRHGYCQQVAEKVGLFGSNIGPSGPNFGEVAMRSNVA